MHGYNILRNKYFLLCLANLWIWSPQIQKAKCVNKMSCLRLMFWISTMSRDALTYSREKPKHDGVHGSFLLALGSFHKELISPDPSITVVSEPVGKLRPREYIKNPYVKKKKKNPYVIQWPSHLKAVLIPRISGAACTVGQDTIFGFRGLS